MEKKKKNEAAVALGIKRYESLKASFKTPEELSEYMKQVRKGKKKLNKAKS